MHTAEPPVAPADERELLAVALRSSDAAIANRLHTIGRSCRLHPERHTAVGGHAPRGSTALEPNQSSGRIDPNQT